MKSLSYDELIRLLTITSTQRTMDKVLNGIEAKDSEDDTQEDDLTINEECNAAEDAADVDTKPVEQADNGVEQHVNSAAAEPSPASPANATSDVAEHDLEPSVDPSTKETSCSLEADPPSDTEAVSKPAVIVINSDDSLYSTASSTASSSSSTSSSSVSSYSSDCMSSKRRYYNESADSSDSVAESAGDFLRRRKDERKKRAFKKRKLLTARAQLVTCYNEYSSNNIITIESD